MESEKIKKLKEQYTDKSLTKAQRQAILEEIAKENYRMDKRKPMTLYNYRLLQFWGFFLSFITKVLNMISAGFGIEKNMILNIACVLFGVTGLIFLILWFAALLSRKIDREDELAKENLNQARSAISAIVMFGLVLSQGIIILIDDIMNLNLSFTIHAGNIGDIAMLILWGYFALESGIFLHYEGKTISDDEMEED